MLTKADAVRNIRDVCVTLEASCILIMDAADAEELEYFELTLQACIASLGVINLSMFGGDHG